jgi:hypothetical protein
MAKKRSNRLWWMKKRVKRNNVNGFSGISKLRFLIDGILSCNAIAFHPLAVTFKGLLNRNSHPISMQNLRKISPINYSYLSAAVTFQFWSFSLSLAENKCFECGFPI